MRRNSEDMASKLSSVKEIVMELLSDENEHTTDDIKKQIISCGIDLDLKSSVIRTAIYQLRSNGEDIYSRDRGVYQLRKKGIVANNSLLKDFEIVLPDQRNSPKRVYIHSNGRITMSGRLNAEIKTRQIEIRVSNDAKKIALIPNGEHCHKFTKAGTTKNDSLLKIIKNKRYILPISYDMKQDTNSGIWIGDMQKNTKTANGDRHY